MTLYTTNGVWMTRMAISIQVSQSVADYANGYDAFLGDAVAAWRSDDRLQLSTEACRDALQRHGKNSRQYREAKRDLPCDIPAVLMDQQKPWALKPRGKPGERYKSNRNTFNVRQHTGLLPYDWDVVSGYAGDAASIRDALIAISFVAAAKVSTSNDGVHAVAYCEYLDGLTPDAVGGHLQLAAIHAAIWNIGANLLNSLCGLPPNIHDHTSDDVRILYQSHDPDAGLKTPTPIDEYLPTKPKAVKVERRVGSGRRDVANEDKRPDKPGRRRRGPTHRRAAAVPNDDVHYDDWIRVMFAFQAAVDEGAAQADAFAAWMSWSAKSTKHDASISENAWGRYPTHTITPASLINRLSDADRNRYYRTR